MKKILLIVLPIVVLAIVVVAVAMRQTTEPIIEEEVDDPTVEEQIIAEEIDEVAEEEQTLKEAEKTLLRFLEYAFINQDYDSASESYKKIFESDKERVKEELKWSVESFGVGEIPLIKKIEILNQEKKDINNLFEFEVQIITEREEPLTVSICCDPETGDYIVMDTHSFIVEKIEGRYYIVNFIYQP